MIFVAGEYFESCHGVFVLDEFVLDEFVDYGLDIFREDFGLLGYCSVCLETLAGSCYVH